MKVRFLAFYDINKNVDEERISPMSSKNVIDYIIEKLIKNGNTVEIISMSTTKKVRKYFPSSKTEIQKNVDLVEPPTYHSDNRVIDLAWTILTRCWFIVYLLKNTSPGDYFIVWHSIPMMRPVLFLKKVLRKRRNKFIFYVGELYQKVIGENLSKKRIELEKKFLKNGDAYILSTFFLQKTVNSNVPNIILPGVLSTYPKSRQNFSDEDGKVHIVYSGIINSTKGAFIAVDMAKYLGENFKIHIVGWSNDRETIDRLKLKISENNKKNKCKVVYDGVLKGKEYDEYISSCDVGICPQNENATYTNFSFPSKVLAYLGHSLSVVCVDIPTIKNSLLSENILFVPNNDPYLFANKIKQIDISFESKENTLLKKLDHEFEDELTQIFKNDKGF